MEDEPATKAGAQALGSKSPGLSTLSRTQRGAIAAQVSSELRTASKEYRFLTFLTLPRHATLVAPENRSAMSRDHNAALARNSSWSVGTESLSPQSMSPAIKLTFHTGMCILAVGSFSPF